MDFVTAIKTCLTVKYATFTGRALRSEYWFFYLFVFLGGIAANIIDRVIFSGSMGNFGPVYALFTLAMIVPVLAAGARRLHDIDRSGWWQLIYFIPIIGLIIMIIWLATKGEDGDNRFGPPPKAVAA